MVATGSPRWSGAQHAAAAVLGGGGRRKRQPVRPVPAEVDALPAQRRQIEPAVDRYLERKSRGVAAKDQPLSAARAILRRNQPDLGDAAPVHGALACFDEIGSGGRL